MVPALCTVTHVDSYPSLVSRNVALEPPSLRVALLAPAAPQIQALTLIYWPSWLRIIKNDPEVFNNPPDPSKQKEIPTRKDTQADLLGIPLSDKDKNRAY